MNLLIVESPNKIKKIQAILGNGWDVAASVGHVRDLPPKTLGIAAPDYQLEYEFNERGKGVLDSLRPRAARAEIVYLATDPDREGEAIAWHLKETLKLEAYQRVTFDAITEPVIRKALAAPRQLDMNLIHAQEARRGADRLVGYQVSPMLSRQTGIAGLSAGRVQTVAVRFVVDRQREIKDFRVIKHFGAEAIFEDGKWTAQWDTGAFLKAGEKYILDSPLADQAALCIDFEVVEAETKSVHQSPPPPFTTATLLQAASVSLGYKPDQTAQLAQKLFEQGLITYHRTDSQNFSIDALHDIREYAQAHALPIPAKPRTWKSKESAQEAHEAIRPTHLEGRTAGENEDQKKLYAMIWNRAIASQLADAEYSVNTLLLESRQGLQVFAFRSTGRTLIVAGWKGLTAEDAAEEPQDSPDATENNGKVPSLPVGSIARASGTRVLNRQTKPPSGYTQAGLIKRLEKEGIGRPSTYPTILKNIFVRGYISEGKKTLFPTELGELLIDALKGKFRFVEYEYTRELEQQLDEIAKGNAAYLVVVSALDRQLQVELGQMHIVSQHIPVTTRVSGGAISTISPDATLRCPKCNNGLLRRPNGRDFYGCDQYRAGCTFSVNVSIAQKKLTDKQLETLCTKGKTGVIKGFINNQGKSFEAILLCSEATGWRTKFAFENKPAEPKRYF
jgi:DNA topoisomerase-1